MLTYDNLHMDVFREQWFPGDVAWFEYHCNESPDSAHAEWWYRSQQQVAVLSEADSDGQWGTFAERSEGATPKLYTVRWADGFEGDVFEDELLIDPSGFERPAPPALPAPVKRATLHS